MSDIQEQIKLAHKRAEENDNRNELYGVKVIVSPEVHKELLKRKMIEENEILNDLQNRIDKAIEYIWSTKYEYGDLEEDNEDFDIDVYELLKILKGDNK